MCCDVAGPSVVASFHGKSPLRAQKGVETVMVWEVAEKGRIQDGESAHCEQNHKTDAYAYKHTVLFCHDDKYTTMFYMYLKNQAALPGMCIGVMLSVF